MKIVCDRHIPFLVEAVRAEWPDVQICPMESGQISADTLRDADVLVVRTRTTVNQSLLAGTSVRLVGTATIGFDHIDTTYCEQNGIAWMACPGCNAQAVCDYIEEVLDESKITNTHTAQADRQKSQITIGIIGVGHVGSLVAKMAERRGLRVLLNDPPKNIGVSLEEIAKQCDIVTFHTPLDATTYHLCNETFLSSTKPDTLIINAARGSVVDEQALLRSGRPFVLDTWENEPNINTDVLAQARLASMHIAGYSLQGKLNASQMCLDAIAQRYGLKPVRLQSPITNHKSPYGASRSTEITNNHWLADITATLKAHPEQFEQLRQTYPLR